MSVFGFLSSSELHTRDQKKTENRCFRPMLFSVMTHVQFTGTLFRYRVSGLISRSPGQTAVPYAA